MQTNLGRLLEGAYAGASQRKGRRIAAMNNKAWYGGHWMVLPCNAASVAQQCQKRRHSARLWGGRGAARKAVRAPGDGWPRGLSAFLSHFWRVPDGMGCLLRSRGRPMTMGALRSGRPRLAAFGAGITLLGAPFALADRVLRHGPNGFWWACGPRPRRCLLRHRSGQCRVAVAVR